MLRGFERPFRYLVDRKDADRIAKILDGDCEFEFVAFDSVGRSVHVSVKDIQYAQVLHEVTTLLPGVKYGAGELQPTFSDVRLYFRGRAEPLSVDAFQMDEDELMYSFADLDCACDCTNQCIAFDDEDGDVICVRAGELVLAEIPQLDLLMEMDELDDEFWSEASP